MQLGPDDAIAIISHKPSEAKALSMLHFLAHQAHNAGCGPTLNLKDSTTLDGNPYLAGIDLIRPCVYMALGCRNLQSLCLGLKLSISEVLTILKLAPCGLQALALCTSMGVVSDVSSWQRLGHLARVELTFPRGGSTFKPRGLAGLRALQHLVIIYDTLCYSCDCMDLSETEFPRLLTVSFNMDPFVAVGLSCFPALEEVMLLYPAAEFPDWSLRRSIKHLGCCDWPAAFEYHMDRLQELDCTVFHAVASSNREGLPIGPLLALPAAKLLRVSQHQLGITMQSPKNDKSPLLTLTGTLEQYVQLRQKLQFHFDPDVEVQVRFDSSQAAHAISSSGHAVLCSCAECQKQA